MSNKYDPAKHSKKRLGAVGSVPIFPMMPIAAQITPSFGGPKLHVRFEPEGGYVNAHAPAIEPARVKEVYEAVQGQPDQESWSGTGRFYKVLDVVPSPDGNRVTFKAGDVTVGIGVIDPNAPIVSLDEPIGAQIADGTGVGDDDDDDQDQDQDPDGGDDDQDDD